MLVNSEAEAGHRKWNAQPMWLPSLDVRYCVTRAEIIIQNTLNAPRS